MKTFGQTACVGDSIPVTVRNFDELRKALDGYRASKRWVFRGHADANWGLVPKAGRK
jgi:hypothetical protein